MSNVEENLIDSIRALIKATQRDLNSQTPEPTNEVKSDLPVLLDRVQMMELYKIKDGRTFKRKLDSGLIPKSRNPLGRKQLWNRDVVLKSICNG